MSKTLKLEISVADLGQDGVIVSEFATTDYVANELSKKATLNVEGKVDPSLLPDYTYLDGLVDKLDDVEQSFLNSDAEILNAAKLYSDNKISENNSKKADLVEGKVPFEQLPFSMNFEQNVSTEFENVRQELRQNSESIVAQMDGLVGSANSYTDGKVLEEREFLNNTINEYKGEVNSQLNNFGNEIGAVKNAQDDIIKNGASLPYDPDLEYVDGALTLKDGEIQQFDGGIWSPFNKTVNASDVVDESGLRQQEVNDVVEFTLDTVGDLRNYKARKNRQIVKVARHNVNLTAESSSTWAWHDASTDQDDGNTVIQVTGIATGRWKICNKEKLNIFNFGVTDYKNVAVPVCNYYISNANLTAYFSFCNANKLRAKVFGNILVEAGNYNLPDAGLIGDGKATTSLYCSADQTGFFLTYGVLNDYNKAMGEPLQAITVRTINGTRQQANLVKIITPSRGCVLRDVNMTTDGDCVNLDDAYYLNFDNCGFFGSWRANFANITLESDKFTGVGVRTSNKEINNVLFHKCDFKDLKQFVVGQGDPFKGSNTILFSNTAFERCGDLALAIEGWNATFLTCYFEYLDLHKNFKAGLTGESDVTVLASTGSGAVQFLGQTIINLGNIRATDANVCVFNSILDMVSLSATYMNLPANFAGRMNHYKAYSSTPAIHWSGLTPVPQIGYVSPVRHIAQKDTNAFRSLSRVEQSSHPYVSVEKMGTNYKSLVGNPSIQYSSTNSKPLNGVDGLIGDKPILVHMKGRQYRIGSTSRTEWIDIDGVFRIDKECPYYATKVALTVTMGGTTNTVATDSFFNSLTGQAIADRIKMWRLTTARGTDYATNYAFAYQIGITGETTGNGSGHYIVNDLEIQVIQTAPTSIQAQYTGIYAQDTHFVANPTQ